MIWLTALLLTPPAAPPSIAEIPEPAEFGDWIVVCNNIRDCEAIAAKPDIATGSNWTLRTERGAGSLDEPTVSAAPSFDFYDKPTTIRIDGRNSTFAFDASGYLTSNPIPFLKAIARARSAQVIGPDGEVFGDLPVTGASAGLRWIDDQQKRVGTVTAIVANGTRPASAVPPTPRIPSIAQPNPSDAPARTLGKEAIAAVKEAGECSTAPGEAEFYRLDKDHSVGIIPCMLGAYQASAIIVIVDEAGDWSFAPIEQPRELSISYRPVEPWMYAGITTADYAPATRMLYEFAKGRGLADCGQSASWAWDGEMFRLASFNEMRECRGTPPGDWPSLWVTENAQMRAAD
ncbi:DUF1176 domain-containing protein [Erythrobacter sp. YT30]|uniref:DUF1176 domain-containing protein n=1 Tax=Erythrobacter sp. YT30 TaxID=1735012 RepID=UPI00076D33FF|nr:DUF1176 domain-containing protein [Erythrobacter sp. YT30]KWV91554.1 hypothetical protein AUC45_09990 [Erythrobacter sp. YT30]